MLKKSLKILEKIEQKGFKAYIVGGFVRDYILGRKSSDIDIATNATPKQIQQIFPNISIPNEAYGSITIIYSKIRFEITTFRKELIYSNNRKPVQIEYIDNLIDDLKRRDFTVNTLCINSSGKILDMLNATEDLNNKIIKTVGNSIEKFTEDALRILRAVRFATVLDFHLDFEVITGIKEAKKYLANISYERKKEELDKIFMSQNAKYGVELLLKLGLDDVLDLYNLKDIKLSNDLLGVWSSLKVSNRYPFSKTEKELIKKIKEVEKHNNYDKKILYKYGLYVNSIAAANKGDNKKQITKIYNSLPIKSRSDILINSNQIMKILNRKPGKYINEIYNDLENQILDNLLENKTENLITYIIEKYKED